MVRRISEELAPDGLDLITGASLASGEDDREPGPGDSALKPEDILPSDFRVCKVLWLGGQ